MLSPEQIGLFSVKHRSLAVFLTNAKIRVVGAIVGLLGRQVLCGSLLGSNNSKNIFHRIRQALSIPLAVVAVWLVFMVIRAGSAFFSTGIAVRSASLFAHPIIRETIGRLPAVLTGHILLTILATTMFALPINVSFRV